MFGGLKTIVLSAPLYSIFNKTSVWPQSWLSIYIHYIVKDQRTVKLKM